MREWLRKIFRPTLDERIDRVERHIDTCEHMVGQNYRNPLGQAFDLYDSQREHDDFWRGDGARLTVKLRRLKGKRDTLNNSK